MTARVVGVDQVGAARPPRQRRNSGRAHIETSLSCRTEQRTGGPGQKKRPMARAHQSLDQVQRLPLAAAHFPTRIDVQCSHASAGAYGLMFLAFAYFRNVYVAAM